jgi:hypothetical protein
VRTAAVEIRVAGLPQLKQFIDAVAGLLRALAEDMPQELPAPVMAAADEVHRAIVALGGKDVGPPP